MSPSRDRERRAGTGAAADARVSARWACWPSRAPRSALAGWFLRVARPADQLRLAPTRCPRRAQDGPRSPCSCGALLAAGAAAGVWIWRRAAGLDVIERASRRLAPLCLAAFVPLLFHWQLWAGGPRELTFLVMVGGVRPGAAGADARRAGDAAACCRRAGAPASTRSARASRRALARMPWLPLAIVGVAVIGYAIVFLDHHHPEPLRLGTAGYDLGIENNLVWNAAHFNAPAVQDVGDRRPERRRTSAITRRTSRI